MLNSPWIDFRVMMAAGQAVLDGINPYTIEWRFYTPLWSIPGLTLLASLPLQIALVIWTILSVSCWVLFLYKMSNKDILAVLIFMCNPFFLRGLVMGSYDWVVVAGALLPFQYGVWLMALKPQVAFVCIMVWAKGVDKRIVLQTLIPIAILFLAAIFTGFYRAPDLEEMYWNTSLFPYSIPLGLILVWFSLKRNDSLLALAAAPLLSPYVGIQSWAFVLLPFIRNRHVLILAVILGWIIYGI